VPRQSGAAETPGLFGRGYELGVVDAFLDGLPAGPSGLLIDGEAGIGKTTVWTAGVTAAGARSHLILSSRPAEAEAKLSFAALADLMNGILERVLSELPAPQQEALEVALLLKTPAGRPPEHRAVCAAFLGVMRLLAAQGPVIIAVDDLQWLDRPSAVTIDYALRRLESEPVGLLASVRTQAGVEPPLLAGAGLPTGRLKHLTIGPLASADFDAAMRTSVGDRLSRLTIRRLFEATGGNVFYGIELARALERLDAEPSPGEPLPVPGGLHGVLGARIAALPIAVQEVLLVASCLRSPTASMLELATGPTAWRALQSAAAEGVVEIDGPSVRFTHPLLASAIYSGVAPSQRRAAHRRLSVIADGAEERARHQALSVDGPDEEVAAALTQAAQTAAARGAPGTAAELAELAVARTPVGLASVRRRRRLSAAEYLFTAGDTGRAKQNLEALADDMPSGVERAQALLVLARLLLHDAGDVVAVPVLEKALAEASADRVLQARVHISLARTCGGDLRYCASHAEAGLMLAQRASDQGLIRQALAEKLYAGFMLGGDLRLGADPRHEADDILLMAADPVHEPAAVEERASTILGMCLVRADRFDEARYLFRQATQAAEDEGDESSLPVLLAYLADLECWAGNWQVAERYARESWEMSARVDHRAWQTITFYARALVDAHVGRIEAAKAEAAEGLTSASAAGDDWAVMMLHGVLGFAEFSAGNLNAADASLSTAAYLADRIGLAEPAAWRFHANHVEVAIGIGDLQRAQDLLAWLEQRGQATGRIWTTATAARCRGLLLAAHGDTPAAVEELDEALRHHERLAMPFELGRTLLIAGQIQRRAKSKRLAKQHLDQALAIFEGLPAVSWAARARSELSRIGLRPSAPLELTATELRVAELAASGRTNREVATTLFLSPRTVEANLARAYRKLGVSSRAELGAVMARSEQPSDLRRDGGI
jgi:DNA-binding CsgD family transcriptional regulator